MNPAELTFGDLVRLKSDGPDMTVESVDGPTVKVVWFTVDSGGAAKVCRDSFPIVCLDKVVKS